MKLMKKKEAIEKNQIDQNITPIIFQVNFRKINDGKNVKIHRNLT